MSGQPRQYPVRFATCPIADAAAFEAAQSSHGMEVDERGVVYVSDAGLGQILLYDLAGRSLGRIGSPGTGNRQFNAPLGIAADLVGRIYIADSGNNRVQILRSPSEDVTPPSAVGALTLLSASPVAIRLSFLSPGDDGMSGQPRQYQVRFATFPIADAAAFEAAQPSQPLPPQIRSPGSVVFPRGAGLEPGKSYFVGARAVDEAGNAGPVASFAAATPPRVPLGTLSLWAGTASTFTNTTNDLAAASIVPIAVPGQLALDVLLSSPMAAFTV